MLINPNEELTPAAARQKAVNLAVPAVIENFLMSLVGMVDQIMVGQLGAAATAAVGITNNPVQLATAVFQALNVGTTSLIARLIGSGDRKLANEAARQTLVLIICMSFTMAAFLYALTIPILTGMGAEEDTMFYAVDYFKLSAISLIFNQITMTINSQVRGAGDTRTPMKNNIVTNMINLFANIVLINGYLGFPRLEVYGAGLASIIARFCGMCMALSVVLRGDNNIHIDLKSKFRFNWDIAARVSRVGFPSAIEQFVMRGGNLLFVTTVTGLGTTTYAAHVIANNINSLSMTPGQGFSMAATTLTGQSLGAKRPDWAEMCGWETQKISMSMAVPMSLFLFFGGVYVARLYNPDPAVYLQASTALKYVAFTQVPRMSQVVLAGSLRGAGDTKWTLISTFVGMWIVRLVLARILVGNLGWGLSGAWLALAADQLARSALIMMRYRSGKWKAIKV